MEIRNYNEVLEILITLLKQFDKDLNDFQTDVYFYYNEETQEVKVDTFVNVGGNTWLDDNHYTAFSDDPHYYSFVEYFETLDDIASVLGTTKQELIKATAESYLYDVSEVEEADVRSFIENRNDLRRELWDYYVSKIDTDYNGYYTEKAEMIIDGFYRYCELHGID